MTCLTPYFTRRSEYNPDSIEMQLGTRELQDPSNGESYPLMGSRSGSPAPSDLTTIANAIPAGINNFNAATAGLTLGAGLGTYMTAGFTDLSLSEWALGTTCVIVGTMYAAGNEILARSRTEPGSAGFECRSIGFVLALLSSSALVLGVSLHLLQTENGNMLH